MSVGPIMNKILPQASMQKVRGKFRNRQHTACQVQKQEADKMIGTFVEQDDAVMGAHEGPQTTDDPTRN